VVLPNRIMLSPMCQYSSVDGYANDWHRVHLGSRAVGGAGLVMAEASAVEERGRITPADLGIYRDEHIPKLREITDFIRSQGVVPGIQIAHAGRKASTAVPWEGGHPLPPESGGWTPVGPSPIPFAEGWPVPHPLTVDEINDVVAAFSQAAERARKAGFDAVEIHSAHGYLLHSFLSPLSNKREDDYGGSLENRERFLLRVVEAVRISWPDDRPVFVRISATDWVDGGWDLDQSVHLARRLKELDVDLIDCSSGGLVLRASIPVAPGYQIPLAARIRREAEIATAAVGLITHAEQAEAIVSGGSADLVAIARAFLRDPYWPQRAARALGQPISRPIQYLRAWD
jgi:2,4-dienoyl-CoA reductase-like NADH-dependent reductase (Old Yellow Enzyme family)